MRTRTVSSNRKRTAMPRRDETSRAGGAAWVAAGVIMGLTVGLLGWSVHQHRSRRSLFNQQPVKRLAALGYLRAHPSVDSARLLRDYLRWEPHPLLRRNARRVLRRTERMLRS